MNGGRERTVPARDGKIAFYLINGGFVACDQTKAFVLTRDGVV